MAPWMKVMDAVSDMRFYEEGLTDFPVPTVNRAKKWRDAGIPCGAYYCCGPRGKGINRHFDTPLTSIRIQGWLYYHLRVAAFLHWSYNYWYEFKTRNLIDPYVVTDAKVFPPLSYGDFPMAYPGKDGPVDSLRCEVFHESLQDYALLETCGVDPDGPLLAPCRDFDDFPRTEQWIAEGRRRLLMPGKNRA